ncbi:putative transposase, Ptta/En/Spm, plant [Helianthus anomalus]
MALYEWKSQIHSCWEKCIKGKFPDLLKRAREKAKALACEEGIEVGDDLTRIIPFKPFWINQESWETLVEAWNTDLWKKKYSQNSKNRGKVVGRRHTLGSKSYVTEKSLKRCATFGEFWLQTHAKKGSRPPDKLVGSSRSVENGSGEDDEGTYDKYVVDKYGEDTSLHPEFDMELWSQTIGGNKKGRLYGIGNIADPHNVIPGASSMPITQSSNP